MSRAAQKLEALQIRCGQGFGLSPSQLRRVLRIALEAAKLPRPPAELRQALEELTAP